LLLVTIFFIIPERQGDIDHKNVGLVGKAMRLLERNDVYHFLLLVPQLEERAYPGNRGTGDALAAFVNRPASCQLKRRWVNCR